MAQEASKENGLMFVKFENQKVPEFKQVRGKDWVYWGETNDYPDYLIDLFMRSSTNNAIITGKVNYILGNGWKVNKAGMTMTNTAIANDFISSINTDESLDELSNAVFLDFEIFNGFALEVIWNKLGTDFDLFHIPFNKIRTNEDQSKYYYSKDWSSVSQSEEKTGLKEYLPFDAKVKKGSSIFLFQITAPRKGKDPNVYSMPEYIGSTQAMETDLECSNYNLSEIKTGFSAGSILNFFNGIPDEPKKKEIERMIKSKFMGTDRAGGIIVNFADGKDRGSDVTSLNGNDLDKRYIELKKDVRQEIFCGHKVCSPILFGIKTEGQLGGRTEIIEAYELFQNTYVSKRQRILAKVFNKFYKLKGISGKLYLEQTTAIGFGIPDGLITQAMPIDFVKEKLGIVNKETINADVKIIVNAINSLSPLVASKVLESMSVEEIRGLVGLTGGLVKTTTKTQTDTLMSAHKLTSEFKKIGRSKSLFNIYKSCEIENATFQSVLQKKAEYFANELTADQRAIIDLLNKEENTPTLEIAKALKISNKEVEKIIDNLVELEYLNVTKLGFTPSAAALDIVIEEGAKTANIELLYSYELRKNAPDLKGVSRDFCIDMVKMNKLYTYEEIQSLSNDLGTDVWQTRGGWYSNPNTAAPTPQCRHIWVQNVTKLK
jgi:DNA-binding Lrp family transcriptional regulator